MFLASLTAVFFTALLHARGLFPTDQHATLPLAGPHVVNAAFESLISLGIRKFLLLVQTSQRLDAIVCGLMEH